MGAGGAAVDWVDGCGMAEGAGCVTEDEGMGTCSCG